MNTINYVKTWTVDDYLQLWKTGRHERFDRLHWGVTWTIERYYSEQNKLRHKPFDESQFFGNLALNEGITALLNLLTGAAETAFSNANAYIGVGDDTTAANAAQTGLIAASNKLYKAMEATYPQIASQTVTFRSSFGSAEANFAWEEFTVASGNSDAADNLNRKVSAQGTKASGQTWVTDVAITVG